MVSKKYWLTCIGIYAAGLLIFFTAVYGICSIYVAVAIDFILAGVSLWTLAKYINENRSSKQKSYYLYVILLLIPFICFTFTGIITTIVLVIWSPLFG